MVEEQLQSRSEIDGMLEKPEYSTVLSGGGDEAIAHIERDPPYDLVLSDLMMAGSGWQWSDRADAPGTAGYSPGVGDAQ